MKTIQKKIRRAEKLENGVQEDENRLVEIGAQLRQKRVDATAVRESIALDVLRAGGVFELPVSKILELLSGMKIPEADRTAIPSALSDASMAEAETATERATSAPQAMVATRRQRSRGSRAIPGTIRLTMKKSRNVATRAMLEKAGWHWYGKAGGHWRADVDSSVAAKMTAHARELVGDDVSITTGTAQPTKAAKPATPPVDPAIAQARCVDVDVDRAGSAMEAAETTPASSAPAQEQPPAVASIAAGTPRPAGSPFANFPRTSAPR